MAANKRAVLLQTGRISIEFAMREFWGVSDLVSRAELLSYADEAISLAMSGYDFDRLSFHLCRYQTHRLRMPVNYRACEHIADCLVDLVKRVKAATEQGGGSSAAP